MGCRGREKLGAHAQRLIDGVAEAKHPGIAARGADGAADLIGESLKGEGVMRGGEGAREGFARAGGLLRGGEDRDRFLEAAFEQVAESVVGHAAESWQLRTRGQVVAVNRGEEEERADAFVEIGFAAPIGVEFGARREQLGDGATVTPPVDGLVASRGIGGLDEIDDAESHTNLGTTKYTKYTKNFRGGQRTLMQETCGWFFRVFGVFRGFSQLTRRGWRGVRRVG